VGILITVMAGGGPTSGVFHKTKHNTELNIESNQHTWCQVATLYNSVLTGKAIQESGFFIGINFIFKINLTLKHDLW